MKIKDQLKCELARREFYEYCRLLHPDFYKKDRKFLKELCDKLQDFYYNDDEFMLVNEPPRHGKSFTATNYVEWIFGKNPLERIISASYSHDLSKGFSKKVRGTISTEKIGNNIVYNDIFPNTTIKYGSAEAMKWQTELSDQINYLATSPSGAATGFGCTLMVVDDIIKNAEEANNQLTLEKHWEWLVNTMLSRREGKKKVLIIMTRWSSKDLAGRIINHCEEKGFKYSHINFKVEQDDGTMLCDEIFSKEDAENAKELMGEDIYSANYNQITIDLKGVLYTNLLTYNITPDFEFINSYTDTADKGTDYLCSIVYGVKNKQAYVLDVVYTQEPMEITEKLVADMLTRHRVNYEKTESNNGGRGFARNVERLCREMGNRHTMFTPFTQTKNKEARILSNSTGVMQNIFFPENWKYRFPEFYRDITTYQRAGKNKHDDAPDALTGVYENISAQKWGW